MARAFPETLVLRNDRRLGYAANLNRVLDASAARYVLLMNTDMYFDPREQCLARMVTLMDGRPRCGVAGCRLYHADGADARAARRFPTLPLILRGAAGWAASWAARWIATSTPNTRPTRPGPAIGFRAAS